MFPIISHFSCSSGLSLKSSYEKSWSSGISYYLNKLWLRIAVVNSSIRACWWWEFVFPTIICPQYEKKIVFLLRLVDLIELILSLEERFSYVSIRPASLSLANVHNYQWFLSVCTIFLRLTIPVLILGPLLHSQSCTSVYKILSFDWAYRNRWAQIIENP